MSSSDTLAALLDIESHDVVAILRPKLANLHVPLNEMLSATNNFADDNLIKRGRIADVYKGKLRSKELNDVFIRRFRTSSGLPHFEFLRVVATLSRLHHTNILSFVGFCDDNDEMMMVFNYEIHGSLDQYLSDSNLKWSHRLKICLGAARALRYIHKDIESCLRHGYHHDIKSTKILFDIDWEAKLFCFGFQIAYDVVFRSTSSYTDPSGERWWSHMSDVYSFGVILFEVLCGRKAMFVDGKSLVPMATHLYKKGKLVDMINHGLRKQMHPLSLSIFSELAYECVNKRSTMDLIVERLQEALDLHSLHERLVNHMSINMLPVGYMGQSHGQSSYSSDDLPKAVVMTLNQGSVVKSMDFHPLQQILLLVGSSNGEIMIWELGSREKIAHKNFKVWDLGACPMPLQASLTNDISASINRVTWSPDGTLFGVAYSKHIVQIYFYHGGDDLRNHLEIDAHGGSVNDLAFAYPNKQLCIVTCGDDRLIKVWDAVTGTKQYTFEGHEAPVYSVCPHVKENVQFIFSIATDGKIKLWLYDTLCSRVDCDAPGHSSTTMAYSADRTRLFSCGTNKEGDSYIVEWNESSGGVKRTYNGLGKRSVEVVQFDTTKNRFLAAGDEFMIKFWDMDNVKILTTTDADGGLLASPCIKFNKEGILMAVSTTENGIKILANPDGIRLLGTMENRPFDAFRLVSASASVVKLISSYVTKNRVTPMPSMVQMEKEYAYLKIPLDDIMMATENFASTYCIRSHRDYMVYKADINHFDIKTEGNNEGEILKMCGPVTIRRNIRKDYEQVVKKFIADIKLLARRKHPNIVSLVGFSCEDCEMILIFES
ncbi:uncharacterized protein [Rutidosis leptorrhynchoides]|uniref:uncharacterized protein n=1 Tax=Rutidosis leptorrhynchoides TaxID=125765 RepID=UPI003A994A6F